MPTVSLRIPQMGEGLQEARLVAVLKQPGDTVRRDEPIYQMETDKAVMDVESPYEGKLVDWVVPVDTLLPIGAEVAKMEVAEGVEEIPAAHHGPGPAPVAAATAPAASPAGAPAAATRRLDVPPRTRAYAKEKGLGEADLANIPAKGSKLMPEDIDAYLAGGTGAPAAEGPRRGEGFEERPMGQKQRLLSSRLVRGAQLVVPGTISVAASWQSIENVRASMKASGGDFQPSAFTMFSWAVVQALKDHPSFRTIMVGDATVRTYDHVHLGIAVALPGDELVLAVVEEADKLSWIEYAQRTREKIELARTGKDQATEAVTVSLTNMQAFGLRDAVPVVVSPAVATIFLGEVYNGLDPEASEITMRRYVNLVMTFDHRLVNGVGAAEFLAAIKRHTETIGSLVGGG